MTSHQGGAHWLPCLPGSRAALTHATRARVPVVGPSSFPSLASFLFFPFFSFLFFLSFLLSFLPSPLCSDCTRSYVFYPQLPPSSFPILLQSTPRRFEPLRAEPNGFRVHLLSRSDTVSSACRCTYTLHSPINLSCFLLFCDTLEQDSRAVRESLFKEGTDREGWTMDRRARGEARTGAELWRLSVPAVGFIACLTAPVVSH